MQGEWKSRRKGKKVTEGRGGVGKEGRGGGGGGGGGGSKKKLQCTL